MEQPTIVVQYAEVALDQPKLLAVFPESPFLRAGDMDELRTEVKTVVKALYGTDDFAIEYHQVDSERLPLARPSYEASKNVVLRGGPKDGQRYWQAIPHSLLMVLDGQLHIWRYTPETESTESGDVAVYEYANPQMLAPPR